MAQTGKNVILAATAWMNQPATRAFRLVLAYRPQERAAFVYYCEGRDGDRWFGHCGELFSEILEKYQIRVKQDLYETMICSARLEPEFQPFVEDGAPEDQYRS